MFTHQSILAEDFSLIRAGMSIQDMKSILGSEKASDDCMGDLYLFYGDRWIWAPGGIVKGYIMIDDWKGPCSSASYATTYKAFPNSRSINFSSVKAGFSISELHTELGREKASDDCMGDLYLFYGDRWIWAPGGIVKGYIMIDDWKGPCSSASYAQNYMHF